MKIFISYSRHSQKITTSLAKHIEELGHSAWLDQRLSGGQAWWDQILAAIRDCDVFVFALDQAALNSAACKLEYGYAENLGKPILPILISDDVSTNLLPAALSKIQFVDFRRSDLQSGLKLARAFNSLPSVKPFPDSLPIPPQAPISYLGGLTDRVDSNSALSYQEQTALVADLRRSLRDPETWNDGGVLLDRLRKRQDLFATVAEEIDELRASSKPSASAYSRSPVRQSRDKAAPVKRGAPGPTPPSLQEKVTFQERRRHATAGAIVGVVVGAIFLQILLISGPNHSTGPPTYLLFSLIFGTCFAITGAITGTDRNAIIYAFVSTMVFGMVLWLLFANSPLILGVPFGSIGRCLGSCNSQQKMRSLFVEVGILI